MYDFLETELEIKRSLKQ